MTQLAVDIVRYAEIDLAVRRGTLSLIYDIQKNPTEVVGINDTEKLKEALVREYVTHDVDTNQFVTTENGRDLIKQYAGRDHTGSALAYISRLKKTPLKGTYRFILSGMYFVKIPEKWRVKMDELALFQDLPSELEIYLDTFKVPRYLFDLTRKDINFLCNYGFPEFDSHFYHCYQQTKLLENDQYLVLS